MAGVYGRHDHSVDAKGRMNFPAKFRDYFGERFFITKSLTADCLMVRTEEAMEQMEKTLETVSDDVADYIKRFVIGCAVDVCPDKQGRVAIPSSLREDLNIGDNVVVLGMGDRAEIWDSEKYYADQKEFDRAKIAELAKGLKL